MYHLVLSTSPIFTLCCAQVCAPYRTQFSGVEIVTTPRNRPSYNSPLMEALGRKQHGKLQTLAIEGIIVSGTWHRQVFVCHTTNLPRAAAALYCRVMTTNLHHIQPRIATAQTLLQGGGPQTFLSTSTTINRYALMFGTVSGGPGHARN